MGGGGELFTGNRNPVGKRAAGTRRNTRGTSTHVAGCTLKFKGRVYRILPVYRLENGRRIPDVKGVYVFHVFLVRQARPLAHGSPPSLPPP
ncbi:hypothetical protein RHGRI_018504 [Rhododendron griersonianum]|uniref:Uncharacterized protein n=1 Tax=Rhododendron griersonianum TaxID=479676 RepID=A0AAV6K1W1_9ERIC|nr:hypothetical protein RHGRI_018504 [Rhododendron griersonianum]